MRGPGPQPGRSDYLDFELEIGEGHGREYPVVVLRSPAGEVRETMHFPFDELVLENRLLILQNVLLRSGGKRRRAPSEEELAVQKFGQALFDTLFGGEVRSCYDLSRREAAQQDKGLRLKLRVWPPELNALPWEFMYDPRQAEYVCLSRQTPIVRYLESPRLVQPFKVAPPLRILGMVASPQDQRELDIEREKQRVERATQDLHRQGLVELEWLAGHTWRDLQEAMWGGPWHVFHFVGHGGFDANTDEGFIALANRAGRTHSLSATHLGRLLANHPSLRLVLLNSCEGAKGSERDIFSSTASILVRRGIPAVVAMQYGITDRAAIEFARAFYRALAYGMAVDEAVVAARVAISVAVANTVEWGTPVLYMRPPDGVLFQMTEMPRVAPPPPESPKPLPEIDAERERRLEQLYLDGLDAFWVEEWDKARRSFQTVVDQQPDYQDAAARLQEAKRQQELTRLYAQAQAAQEAGDWPGALLALKKLTAMAPGFKDAAALLETAEKKVRLADLYAQAQRLYQAGRWQAVVNIFAQIAALEPDYPDPEGLLAAARREMREERRRVEVHDLYRRAGQAVDAGQWMEAQRLLRQVQEKEPGYREAKRLLAKAQAEIEREQQEQAQRRRQEQIARLYQEAQDLARAARWRQALAKMEEIHALDPQFADPQEIMTKVQTEVDREEREARRQKELAALYAEAVRLLRAGQYQAALDKWDQVRARDAQYPDRERVQATAGQKLAAPAKAAPPKRDASPATQPKQTGLPGWLWPVAGGAAVLVVIVVVIVAALGGGDGGKATPTEAPRPTAKGTLAPEPTEPAPDVPSAAQPPVAADAGDPWTRPVDSMTMLYVPAGDFLMGSTDADSEADDDEKPQRTVTLDAFWIDKTEVSNAQFRECVEAGACTVSAYADDSDYNGDQQPVVGVDWSQAKAYCKWAGARLPTEAEWEKAARGTDGRIYPWGNQSPDCNKAQYGDCDGQTVQVGSKPAGASPYGALDMAGNVWEWVADWYAEDYYANSSINNPKGPNSGVYKVLRGGGWYDLPGNVRAADRVDLNLTLRYYRVGFRCAGSPGE